jgi:hypothetical protein
MIIFILGLIPLAYPEKRRRVLVGPGITSNNMPETIILMQSFSNISTSDTLTNEKNQTDNPRLN